MWRLAVIQHHHRWKPSDVVPPRVQASVPIQQRRQELAELFGIVVDPISGAGNLCNYRAVCRWLEKGITASELLEAFKVFDPPFLPPSLPSPPLAPCRSP